MLRLAGQHHLRLAHAHRRRRKRNLHSNYVHLCWCAVTKTTTMSGIDEVKFLLQSCRRMDVDALAFTLQTICGHMHSRPPWHVV